MSEIPWSVLGPTRRQRQRIEGKLFAWLEAQDTSLAGEWLRLLRLQPAAVIGYAAAAALSLLLMMPIGWATSALL